MIMKNNIKIISILLFVILLSTVSLHAQVESSTLIMNRGKLWQSIAYGKVGPNFSNWTKRGIGLDWPGFDPSLISENIGGSPSHLVSGGFYIGALKEKDSVLSVEEWSMYAGSITENAAGKYIVKSHRHLYPNGGNHWLQQNPNVGEEVIETVCEYNILHENEWDIEHSLPVRVTRRAHQWSGSQTDENYIIYDYVIKNISEEIKANVSPERFVADTLYEAYILINYGLHCNSRSWSVLFPSLTDGARNTWFNYDFMRNMVFGRAADYPETPEKNEELGYASSMGIVENGEPSGEYLAPGYVGFRLLYASANNDGFESRIVQQGWSAASNSIDLSGPFTNVGSQEAQFDVLRDIRLAANYVDSWADTLYMRKSRMWSLMKLGPFDLAPGDSVRFVVAEIVDGVDYDIAVNPKEYSGNTINQESRKIFYSSADRAKLTFDNDFNHPDPPAAPEFEIDYFREGNTVANVISFGTDKEGFPDPDDNVDDLAGYILYRSSYLPVGPWEMLDTIPRGDMQYLEGNQYVYIDSAVSIGQGYYYALTAYDNGRDSWGVNPTQIFPETFSNRVPPMESSIFANRTQTPFVATLQPATDLEEILVVPNPFIIGEGFSQPGEQDKIQFVNIPNPCTIRIYTVRGDLVKTIEVAEGDGAIVSWDQVTDFGQFVESGVYIFHVESEFGTKIGKLAIVR